MKDSYTPSHTPSDDDFTSSHDEIQNKSDIMTPQDKVFEFCKSPKSVVEIANMLGVNDRRWVRKKYIAPFIGTRLQMTIPDKPNSQNQKYKTIEWWKVVEFFAQSKDLTTFAFERVIW